jgi:hypothetical protein
LGKLVVFGKVAVLLYMSYVLCPHSSFMATLQVPLKLRYRFLNRLPRLHSEPPSNLLSYTCYDSQKFGPFGAGKFSSSFIGNPLATGVNHYILRNKIHDLSIEMMPKIRAISRDISEHIHMRNDRASTRFLAASEKTKLLRTTVNRTE